MGETEAQRQIQQMVNFILKEARDKADEIEAKALEDFNIEKLRMMQQQKEKIRDEYQRKSKQLEVQRAIARSTAVNKARVKKMEERSLMVDKVRDLALKELANLSADSSKTQAYRNLLVDLTVQGLLRLLEDHVVVRCRECDKGLFDTGLIKSACTKYAQIIKDETGADKSVHIEVDKQTFLPPPPRPGYEGKTCSGGVILLAHDSKITCDNTLDTRLSLVVEECKPQIRETLFPQS
ncbi:unnamed protein product [Vitrella brassicaformis CCMP3155]|uniref:V-type proton ATPase subunit E n=1 Tax=Vitrella brassicaformis (strain CCMP3155) TaxID=1169540 RepID=A0A0G4EE82_VITBC|nr:unnamed protein product [Vitrella brassicaformis CCMP3155]|mmetsp:Transcript_21176/g.51701  ORF Transcript_21176/g.51701 Transcript_21176/m.51701 type:complete len:237 (-) Transcript_21176:279-989(-)|eukprot:CEL93649.1 unnamed protein product [Vitrella brassicaformis CCMP3155]